MMSNPLETLDIALRNAKPEVYADLQPAAQIRMGTPRDLRNWFSWRNGQPHQTKHKLFDTYSFVDYQTATAELSHMRSTLWKSPLNFIILLALSRRRFYTLPILTDIAGDGYCYDTIRQRPYYRFKGERDIVLPSFDIFIDFLVQYVRLTSVGAATSLEEGFLRKYY